MSSDFDQNISRKEFKNNKSKNDNNSDISQLSDEQNQDVQKFIKNGVTDSTVLNDLKNKYNDDKVINKIFDIYKDQLKKTVKVAYKFKKLLANKYANSDMSFADIVLKAKKFKTKYSLTDAEFDLFLKYALTDTSFNKTNLYNIRNTPLRKVLGVPISFSDEKMVVKDKDIVMLNSILDLYEKTRMLHNGVITQSLIYRGDSTQANISMMLNQKYTIKHLPHTYIHPVIASLFLFPIHFIEERMIYSNLGGIIKQKHIRQPVLTKPDYEYYWDLVTDPNDLSCVTNQSEVFLDLYHRYITQFKLWESVLNFRSGRFFNDSSSLLLTALDKCNNNVFDAPDLIFVRDEGTILRRLFGVFSLRPIVVLTQPLYISANPSGPVPAITGAPANVAVNNFNPAGILSYNPFSFNRFNVAPVQQITSIPMINIRLPFIYGNANAPQSLKMTDLIQQTQWFIENKVIVPKRQSIVHARDIIPIYVNRRFKAIEFGRLNQPFNFVNLPLMVNGLERINNIPILNYNDPIEIPHQNSKYGLLSVTYLSTQTAQCQQPSQINSVQGNFIVGCKSYFNLACPIDDNGNTLRNKLNIGQGFGSDIPARHTCLIYRPIEAAHHMSTDILCLTHIYTPPPLNTTVIGPPVIIRPMYNNDDTLSPSGSAYMYFTMLTNQDNQNANLYASYAVTAAYSVVAPDPGDAETASLLNEAYTKINRDFTRHNEFDAALRNFIAAEERYNLALTNFRDVEAIYQNAVDNLQQLRINGRLQEEINAAENEATSAHITLNAAHAKVNALQNSYREAGYVREEAIRAGIQAEQEMNIAKQNAQNNVDNANTVLGLIITQLGKIVDRIIRNNTPIPNTIQELITLINGTFGRVIPGIVPERRLPERSPKISDKMIENAAKAMLYGIIEDAPKCNVSQYDLQCNGTIYLYVHQKLCCKH